MKLKYYVMILLLACFLCGSVNASDINNTDLSSTQDLQYVDVVDESLEIENYELDSSSSDIMSEEELLSGVENDDETIIYFDANAEEDGEGSENSPYKYLTDDRVDLYNPTVFYLAPGVYEFQLGEESQEYGSAQFMGITIIGENPENTIINSKYPISFLSDNFIQGVTWICPYFVVMDYPPYIEDSKLYMDNMIIQSLCLEGGQFIISNSEFRDGEAFLDELNSSYGGAIYSLDYSIVSLENCSFINNSAVFGGAINMNSGALIIDNCSFINNTASGYGGAISAEKNTYIEIKNSRFENNDALSDAGGAIYVVGSDHVVMDNVNITDSNALFGSAITLLNSNTIISKSNFRKNQATYSGGAIFSMFGNFTIQESEFSENKALAGGALFLDNLTICSIDSSFNENSAVLGDDIYSFNNDVDFDDNNVYTINKVNLTIYDEGDYPVFRYVPTNITALPSSYNLNDDGWVSSVKHQLVDGNCWAFAAMAALESCILKASNLTYDFSEDNMKNIISSYSNYGWSLYGTNGGGNMDLAVAYLTNWFGPVLESDDSYGASGVLSQLLKSVYHVQNVVYLKRNDYLDNDMIKYALLNYGAVGTSMYYEDKFLINDRSYYYDGSDGVENGNHAITIVGWDDNYSKDNFNVTPAGDGAWIVKNSWGSDWGINGGYFYVSYYDTLFAPVGQDESAYTFLLNDTIKYDKNYQHDLGKIYFFYPFSESSNNLTYYNLYTIEGDEYLAAVSTFFYSNYDYTLEISVNDVVKYTKKGVSSAGYYTIPLDEFIKLSKGDILKVSFNVLNPDGGEVQIPLSDSRYFYNANLFSEGNSFIVKDGDESDLYCFYDEFYSVACIKAFTIVDEIKTNIALTVVDSKITAVVTDQYGNIMGGNVVFKINNQTQDVEIIDGKASLDYDYPYYDIYNITVSWIKAGYAESTNTTSYEIPLDISLKVDDVDYNNDLIINITLGGGKLLKNNIAITIGDYSYSVNQSDLLFKVPDTLNAKLWNISISYVTDNGYNKVVNESFNVNKIDSALDVSDIEFDYGGVGSAVVKFSGASNVVAEVINHTEAVIVNNNGMIEVSNLTGGKYILSVTTVADENHKAITKNVTVTVNKVNGKIDITIPEITPAKSDSIPINLGEDSKGNITLTIDNKIISITPLKNGSATITIPKLNAGNHIIGIIYSGDENHDNFTKTQSVDVASLAKITGENIKSYYIDGSVYKVRVFGDDGTPLKGAKVTFKVNGKKVAVKTTDKNGYATYKITQTPKTYSITAEFNGLKTKNTLTVKQIIKAKKTTKVKKSKTTKIKITLKGKKAYKNKKISVKFNGKTYKIKTNKNGVAKFKVTKKMIKKFKTGKKVKYIISYSKDKITRYVKIAK